MSATGILLTVLLPAIAKTIFDDWLGDAKLAFAVSSEIVDMLRDRFSNRSERREAERTIRRLEILELQAVRLGISTPPEIVTEIEDIKEHIRVIESQLS